MCLFCSQNNIISTEKCQLCNQKSQGKSYNLKEKIPSSLNELLEPSENIINKLIKNFRF